ncbi:N-6 DNA methylase [Nitrosococcus watsonii]
MQSSALGSAIRRVVMAPKSKGDYAFMSHMIEARVAKEGRAAVNKA